MNSWYHWLLKAPCNKQIIKSQIHQTEGDPPSQHLQRENYNSISYTPKCFKQLKKVLNMFLVAIKSWYFSFSPLIFILQVLILTHTHTHTHIYIYGMTTFYIKDYSDIGISRYMSCH